MKKYTPNFDDPRCRRRIEASLEWATTYLKPNKPQWLGTREIQRHFGSQSRPLGIWLKNTLLQTHNHYFNPLTGACKTYLLRVEGVKKIKTALGIPVDADLPLPLDDKILDELATGEFEYREKSQREYHWLQHQPKRRKRPLLAQSGYKYEYDIQCCAQTLLLQHARKSGFTTPTPQLDAYIADRESVRTVLASELGIDTGTVKRILTAMLNGATISTWYDNTIFQLVNYNTLMINHLQRNDFIKEYKLEVRDMWKHIRGTMNLSKGVRLNAKLKSEMYRTLEEEVRVVIKRYMKKNKIRVFIEHDGWSCDTAIEIDRLCYEVKQQTGFVIKLDWTIWESSDCS